MQVTMNVKTFFNKKNNNMNQIKEITKKLCIFNGNWKVTTNEYTSVVQTR